MSEKFVYVTYIRTTQEKVWDALKNPEFTRDYWFGFYQESTWEAGAPWRLHFPDGRVGDTGEILEINPPHRLVISWRNEFRPELKAEGYSRATFTLEPKGDSVKLTVLHEIDRTGSAFLQAVSNGWPQVLSSLKSLLETGKALERPEPPKPS